MRKIKIKGWELKTIADGYGVYDDNCDIMIHVDKLGIGKHVNFDWLYLYAQKHLIVSIWIKGKDDINKINKFIEETTEQEV